MVIHDMRNPTNQIEFALKEVLKMLSIALGNSHDEENQEFKTLTLKKNSSNF
jgi:hypothetical protein